MMSCSDSSTEQNGVRPWYLRIVESASRRPVITLCGIGLVADVPEDLVGRRVEQRVQRDSQLAGAEVRAEVAADLPDRVDDVPAHLLRELRQLLVGQRVEILRALDAREDLSSGSGSGPWSVASVMTCAWR